jgi:hypothetical protein
MKFNCGPKSFLLPIALGALLALAIPFVLRRSEPPTPAPAPAPTPRPAPADPRPPDPPPPPVAPAPADPLREWPIAIRRRDEKGVLGAQAVFLAREGDYRGPLEKMAREDSEPRVRAFTIAVLGRMTSGPPESFFVERLGDAHEYPRTSALQALEKRGSTACLAKVDELASSDAAPAVRAAAAAAAKAVRSR